jgi:hypothetical protein
MSIQWPHIQTLRHSNYHGTQILIKVVHQVGDILIGQGVLQQIPEFFSKTMNEQKA